MESQHNHLYVLGTHGTGNSSFGEFFEKWENFHEKEIPKTDQIRKEINKIKKELQVNMIFHQYVIYLH